MPAPDFLEVFDADGNRVGRLVHCDCSTLLVARDDGAYATIGVNGARWKALPKEKHEAPTK